MEVSVDENDTCDHISIVDEKDEAHPSQNQAVGTVRIIHDDDICLVPTPTTDPNDPLNMTLRSKIVLVFLVSMYSVVASVLTQGFGGVLSFYSVIYEKQGISAGRVSQLTSMPNVFMGLGNLTLVPVACAVGRRPVFLLAMLITILGALLAAFSTNYTFHLGARMVIGLGAGLSESLVPMMTAEIFFIHERATSLMWVTGIHAVFTAGLLVASSPICAAITPKYWYIMSAAMMGVVFVLSFFFAPETRYTRTASAYHVGLLKRAGHLEKAMPGEIILLKDRPAMDHEIYGYRTLRSELRLFTIKADWTEAVNVYKDMFKTILFPNVLWAVLLNGVAIGQMVSMSSTYWSVLMGEYHWPAVYVSFVSFGQIVVAFVAVPLLGYGSDYLIQYVAKKRNGIHEPETRLIPLAFPLIVGIVGVVLYGEAASHPHKYSWGAIIFAVPAQFFSFSASNLVGISYLVDSYPTCIAPTMILLCAIRGFIGFGIGYSVEAFVEAAGYVGCFSTYAAMYVFLGIWAIVIYFTGTTIRRYCGRFLVPRE